jgi:hypothetical protein
MMVWCLFSEDDGRKGGKVWTMKRKAVVSSILVIVFLVSVFPMSIPSGAVDSANDLRFTSERTSLDNERIDGQAKIVEHRITTSELEKMKREIGVYEKGRDYNQIINGHGTGERPPTEEEWAQIAAKANVVETISLGLGSGPVSNRVDWSTSPWFPPIGDQDGEGSCVSWAVGYYTKTFQEAIEHGWDLTGAQWQGVYPNGYPTPEYQDRIISPAFVYHLTNWGNNTGTYYYDAINLVCSIGACSWAKMPWNPSDQVTWPSENAWREAAYYRGASTGIEYLLVDTAGGILSLKNLIASGNLAMIVVNASQYSSFTSDDVWTVDNYAGGWGHANTIVGYDDNMTYWEGGNWCEGAFKIANSWGVGGWENVPDGCYWISYKAMSERVGYVMFYRDRTGYVPTLTSSFRIEHALRGDCNITIGMGTHDNPEVSKNFTDYIRGGNFSFCPNNIVFDITEFKDVVPNIVGQQFFIRVYDSGAWVTGTILYFAVKDALSSIYAVSSDPPVTTVDGGYVYADLIFGTLAPVLDTFTKVMEQNTTWWDTRGISSPFVLYDNGKYKMWYSATAPLEYGPGSPKVIAYAESTDGIVWSNKTVVHDFGLQGYYLLTGYPWVMKEGRIYRMWHMDYYEWVAGDWSSYISHMSSINGVNWVNETKVLSALGQSNPQGDGFSLGEPCVIYEPGIGYVMWYSVADHPSTGVAGLRKIWRAISNDGLTWSNRQLSLPYISNTWEGIVGHPSVVKEDDGTYVMFYGAAYANGSSPSIGIAESIDGIYWTNRRQLLRPSDLSVNITGLGAPFYFEDVDGKRYLYFECYDKSDEKAKFGRIQLVTIDVAVTNVTPSKAVVGQGYSLRINVTAANFGGYTETFTITAYANTTSIASQAIILTSGNSTIITFTWNTKGFAKGNYTIKAYASPVPGETDTADNTLVALNVIHVVMPGDADLDKVITIIDVVKVTSRYAAKEGDQNYDANVDWNDDGKIDILDVTIVTSRYGQKDP